MSKHSSNCGGVHIWSGIASHELLELAAEKLVEDERKAFKALLEANLEAIDRLERSFPPKGGATMHTIRLLRRARTLAKRVKLP